MADSIDSPWLTLVGLHEDGLPGLCPAAQQALAQAQTVFGAEREPGIYSRELIDVIFEQPYCRISNVVDKGIAKRQTASRYLHALVSIGVLTEEAQGQEKLFVNPRLMQLLKAESNTLAPHDDV